MPILIREFQSPDEEMKKIVLKVVKQCCQTDGVQAEYVFVPSQPECEHRLMLADVGCKTLCTNVLDGLLAHPQQYAVRAVRHLVYQLLTIIQADWDAGEHSHAQVH